MAAHQIMVRSGTSTMVHESSRVKLASCGGFL